MIKRCDNCKHWSQDRNADIYAPDWPDHGLCDVPELYDEYDDYENGKPDIIAVDGNNYLAIILTVRTHYCDKWETSDTTSFWIKQEL